TDLLGKVVVNLFFEASTRTRTSFGLAARRLSADTIDFTAGGSSVSKVETFTIRQIKGRIEGLTVGLVGDIAHSRVARSNIHGLTKLGARVIVCGPPTLVPQWIEELGVEVAYR